MKTIVPIGLLLLVSLQASALMIEGKNYQTTISIENKTLSIVGAGLRKKWFFSIYTMGVYSESGSCDPKTLVNDEEMKYFRMDMLRTISAERMAENLAGAFLEHMPKDASAELAKQQQELLSFFKEECKQGTTIEFVYVPGVGTTIKQNNKPLGAPFVGKEFQRVLWDIYFGDNTCCSGLKDDVFKSCQKKGSE